ncbi:MAG TPA: TldD/PmbA family protein [Candidatus Limnocylindria bacterium]|nr:TldD/PmbA family protein [Candidatus Limnocylindria bacterium]
MGIISTLTIARTPVVSARDAERALRTALSRGGEWAELFWERHETLQLVLDDGRIEDAIAGVDQGAGVRVVDDSGDRTTYANGNVTGVDDLMLLAGRAAASVSEGGDLHDAPSVVPDVLARPHPVAIDPRTVPVERKVALLRLADRVARAIDPRVVQVTVSYGESVQDVLVSNSDGVLRTDTRVRLNFALNVVAKDGEVLESGFEAVRGTRGFEMLDDGVVTEVATIAARRAVLNVGAEAAPAGTYTVVLSSEAGGTLIHESVGHGLEADLNLKGLSVYSGRIGEKVASELITVVDDGRDPGQRGTAAMDDEGTPTQRTVLIENGILRTYLSDRRHAAKLGIGRSGNARRESFRYLPICRMTNTMIERGTSDPDEIVRSVKDGIFVKKMGGGQVDVVSGNFAFEITECYRIRDGMLAEPLRGATLVGQGPKLMSEIDMVGWDLGYSTGTCGKDGQGAPVADAQPTLRIPSVVVGGKLK